MYLPIYENTFEQRYLEMIEQVITYQTDMDHKSEFTKLDFTLVGALKE